MGENENEELTLAERLQELADDAAVQEAYLTRIAPLIKEIEDCALAVHQGRLRQLYSVVGYDLRDIPEGKCISSALVNRVRKLYMYWALHNPEGTDEQLTREVD